MVTERGLAGKGSAVRALLALDEFDSKPHSGVISYFAENFVKTGKIEPEYSKMLTGAFRIRNFVIIAIFL
jgi:uncharacterized protein (UPF0332 family)